MSPKQAKNQITIGKYYQANYTDNTSFRCVYSIAFNVVGIGDNGTETKLYLDTKDNKYWDVKTKRLRSTFELHMWGILDVTKLSNLREFTSTN